jgi:hypothetical protein
MPAPLQTPTTSLQFSMTLNSLAMITSCLGNQLILVPKFHEHLSLPEGVYYYSFNSYDKIERMINRE